ncbi:MAG: ParA family protein [Acidobacteria bacterium]|nr:ParA family protein [Acidobacteriota bacterium]
MVRPVYFGSVMRRAAEAVAGASAVGSVLVIRDIAGRVCFAIDRARADCRGLEEELDSRSRELGAYAGKPPVVCRDDFFEPDQIFKSPAILEFAVPETSLSVRVLERQVTGQDWLNPNHAAPPRVPRIVFYGLKGGVGRSTALAMLAYLLARNGRRVLVIDLDLESPGLSGLLLPRARRAEFGVTDWLIEDGVGQSGPVLQDIVASSPLSDNLRQQIRIAAAMGSDTGAYLDKLSRVYADVAGKPNPDHFGDRIKRLVHALEEAESPDAVLIDSRAGMHDLAAVSVTSVASTALLFATGSPPGWQGYRSLFAHWQSRPSVARMVRERLKMVSALFPESNQAARAHTFLEQSYSLFLDTLYDEDRSGSIDTGLFTFGMDDSDAPHYPLRIKWNSRFQEFDPLQIPLGLFDDDEIRGTFGQFSDGVEQLIQAGGSD